MILVSGHSCSDRSEPAKNRFSVALVGKDPILPQMTVKTDALADQSLCWMHRLYLLG